jgi:hypothetical protein
LLDESARKDVTYVYPPGQAVSFLHHSDLLRELFSIKNDLVMEICSVCSSRSQAEDSHEYALCSLFDSPGKNGHGRVLRHQNVNMWKICFPSLIESSDTEMANERDDASVCTFRRKVGFSAKLCERRCGVGEVDISHVEEPKSHSNTWMLCVACAFSKKHSCLFYR